MIKDLTRLTLHTGAARTDIHKPDNLFYLANFGLVCCNSLIGPATFLARSTPGIEKKPNHCLRPGTCYGKSALNPVGTADRYEHLRPETLVFLTVSHDAGPVSHRQTAHQMLP
jgi:hypothetical protein